MKMQAQPISDCGQNGNPPTVLGFTRTFRFWIFLNIWVCFCVY